MAPKQQQVSIYVRPRNKDLRPWLDEAAEKNKRSLAAEIEERLQNSFSSKTTNTDALFADLAAWMEDCSNSLAEIKTELAEIKARLDRLEK